MGLQIDFLNSVEKYVLYIYMKEGNSVLVFFSVTFIILDSKYLFMMFCMILHAFLVDFLFCNEI